MTAAQLLEAHSALSVFGIAAMPWNSPRSLNPSSQPWSQSYTSFGIDGPYPKLNKRDGHLDRSPLACRSVVTVSGLIAKPDEVPGYPIGMKLSRVQSDFGVEDERKDWLHKPNYGQIPAYLKRVQRQQMLEGEVPSPRLPPIGGHSPRSPRAYCTAYGIPEAFSQRFAGGMVKPPPGYSTRPFGSTASATTSLAHSGA